MTIDLSFEGVSKFIKKDFSERIDDIDTLVNLILFASVLLTGNPIIVAASVIHSFADTLTSKGELTKTIKNIINKITEKHEKDPTARLERMEYAYGLICYTAFFEAIEVEPIFSQLLKEIKLKAEEKLRLSKAAREQLERSQIASTTSTESDKETSVIGYSDLIPILPHPEDNFEEQANQLLPLYKELSKSLLSFIECLAVWDTINETQKAKIKKFAESLPQEALKHFKAQYFLLAAKYPEFYVWSNLQEHEKTRAVLKKTSLFVQRYADLEVASQKVIDLGFQHMADLIQVIPEQIEAREVNIALKELASFYTSSIERPIIDDQFTNEDGKLILNYPKRSEIFIPQAFKVIRRTRRNPLPLENENTWNHVQIRNDLGAFLLSYLSSPYSTLSPLIILGHPGSGKSLLTSMLAARLIVSPYTPIKVELRSVNAEDEIPKQIEDQIYRNIYRKINWAILSDHFYDHPALILLDGYDELLQASGKVFYGYLRKIELFQQNEISIGHRPVRTIVTSRITLIDKVIIPDGATVVRLLEFDQEKQKKWISVWNSANSQYFRQTQTEPFELPQKNEKIATLAEQPLLLLMLALFDSEGNQLRKQKGLDQTVLYDSLLRRFIQRERRKDDAFLSQTQKEQDDTVDRDMERLGVAAIAMFNRRSLHIKKTQLDADLSFFGFEPKLNNTSGGSLSQADRLHLSFFFVQESIAVYKNEGSEIRDADIAFEFLHNTFSEFLTADFILRKVLTLTYKIYKYKHDEELRTELDEKLTNPDGLPKDWFSCLMYTPLFSRPVILDMMREWLKHNLAERKRNEKDFLEGLDIIVSNELKRLLNKNTFPSIMSDMGKKPFGDIPIMGYIAIYSLNLILLRTVLSSNGYIFDEEAISPSMDGTRAWDRLTYIWRSWFSLESLDGLTAILIAERKGSKIYLKAKETFSASSSNSRLDLVLNVSLALADDISTGLAGLLSFSYFEKNLIDLDGIYHRLNAEDMRLLLKLLAISIRHQGWDKSINSIDRIREIGDLMRHNIIRDENSIEDSIICLRELFYALNNSIMVDSRFIKTLIVLARDISRSIPLSRGKIILKEIATDLLMLVLRQKLGTISETELLDISNVAIEDLLSKEIKLDPRSADHTLSLFYDLIRDDTNLKFIW